MLGLECYQVRGEPHLYCLVPQHYHGDPYGSSCLYSDADNVNNHPPHWGWGLDGPKIFGRYTATAQDGASVALDACGGHSHGTYGCESSDAPLRHRVEQTGPVQGCNLHNPAEAEAVF